MQQPDVPKQYLELCGRTVLEWALAPFLARAECRGVVVVVAGDDARWPASALSKHPLVRSVAGGAERADSVLAGIRALKDECSDDDWILVHDAARPCLDEADLQRLIEALQDEEIGGLLAAPVVDTLKRAMDGERVDSTMARERLWRALTPQMFRYGLLSRALTFASDRQLPITDESQAVELLGLHPRLVAGSSDNIKITLPEDVQRAERYLNEKHGLRMRSNDPQ
jgi:2-C-methyl-D-erythritol 4-phosphate cytidylyltransferase